MTAPDVFLLADIGGTNTRIARVRGDARPDALVEGATAEHASAEAALQAYLATQPVDELRAVAVCAAGPLTDGAIQLTNHPIRVTRAGLARAFPGCAIVLVNDFAALAAALPAFGAADVSRIGGGAPEARAARVVIGPGTGLGMAAVVPDDAGRFIAVPSEGGHADLAPGDARETKILAHLQRKFTRVTLEHIVSGTGLPLLYRAVASLRGVRRKSIGAAEIAAKCASDPIARETIEVFTLMLASAARNLALTFAARGGVYLAGGILPRWGALFDEALFRSRFDVEGAFHDFLRAIPIYRIQTPHAALIGLARLAADAVRSGGQGA